MSRKARVGRQRGIPDLSDVPDRHEDYIPSRSYNPSTLERGDHGKGPGPLRSLHGSRQEELEESDDATDQDA